MNLEARNMELGLQVIDMQGELETERKKSADLAQQLELANKKAAELEKKVTSLQDEAGSVIKERDGRLAAERQVELLTNSEKKATREVTSLRQKLSESEKERKELKAHNPAKLKKNLAELKTKHAQLQKVHTEQSKAHHRLKDDHSTATEQLKDQTAELKHIKDTLTCILTEDDHFYMSDDKAWGLKVARYKFPDEGDLKESPVRLRLSHFDTGMLWLGQGKDDGDIEWICDAKLEVPEDINARARIELQSIIDTGTISTRDHAPRFESSMEAQ